MMIYSTYSWDLVQAIESASPASCKTPVTSIDSSAQTIITEETKFLKKKIKLLTNCIVLPWATYIEPKAKKGRPGTQP